MFKLINVNLNMTETQARYLRRKVHEWHQMKWKKYVRTKDEAQFETAVMLAGLETELSRNLGEPQTPHTTDIDPPTPDS